MLITAAEYLKIDSKDRKKMPPSAYCCECKKALRDCITGCRKTKKGPMCDDCYFDAFSKHIGIHPIMPPPPGYE